MASNFSTLSLERVRVQKMALAALEVQKAHLTAHIDKAAAAFQAAKRELDEATASFERLAVQQALIQINIRNEIRALHAHTVATLPEDILSAIFVECSLEDDPSDFFNAADLRYKRASAPFRLASVCQSWRQLALACPRIWTYAAVPSLRTLTPQVQDLHVDRLDLVLRLSADVPLDIAVFWADETELKPVHKRAMLLLQDHYTRWRRVCIDTPPAPVVTAEFFDVFRLPMPLLERIQILSRGMDTLPWNENFPRYFPLRHSLRHFEAMGSNIFYTSRTGQSSSLTFLRVEVCGVPASVVWAICAESAQSLAELFIGSAREGPSIDARPERSLTMPKLRKLSFGGMTDALLWHWSGLLSAPTLEELRLEQYDALTATAFFEHTCHRITSLTLFGNHTIGADAAALRPLHRVQKLIIAHSELHDSFFQVLSIADNAFPTAPWLLPALRTIELTETEIKPEGSDGLLRLIQARREATASVLTSAENDVFVPLPIQTVDMDEETKIARWVRLMVLDEMQRLC
ncbi:hypothetical protein EXIGLDRAFT_725517 [Exidia glandulosa HHB12029]|uniref:Uncharacterized protein n=1 Tax=Exidia glandulosa HHB12029 TaxID=1314781 RepID=A0A165DZY1_EXIGL|nr:hypothetical protein EXIGLDRAFT_725517 [Exidia glandulosa HHB12029]